MNERIWEIAEQAKDQGPNFHYYDPVFLEAYTELIVRECGKSCTLQGDEDDMFRKFGIKHFGVQE